eukprot:gene1101-4330_t
MDGDDSKPGSNRRRLPSAPSTPSMVATPRSRVKPAPSIGSSPGLTPRAPSLSQLGPSPMRTPRRSVPSMQPFSPMANSGTTTSIAVNDTYNLSDHSQTEHNNAAWTDNSKQRDSQNVVVAVRARPFSQRELEHSSPLALTMSGNSTTISNPEKGRTHTFYYDHSFWSHNSLDKAFADQATVYNCIGVPLLDRCLEGYNCSLFAYGQTGSGKSYSMMGIPGTAVTRNNDNHGIIPRFTFELFDRIHDNTTMTRAYTVEVSYFEIYSERVYDLLAPPTKGRMQALKVREHPIMGPYVDNLKTYAVESYQDIEGWLNVGGKHRATASTNMNATSSRSHAVFSMVVTQAEVDDEGEEHCKVSKVNLVDLAGSERSDVAGTTGVRLREGSAINKSLHTLGKVISILADKASNQKKKQPFIPYRDSVLTWILKESLGGNSKTAMLAAVSPAMDNYEESLSTLRYAQQALKIVNVAQINEDPNMKLIRDLRAEIDALRTQFSATSNSSREVATLREKLSQTQALMNAMNRSWEEKLRIAQQTRQQYKKNMELESSQSLKSVANQQPTLVNLNEDPQLSEMLVYVINPGQIVIGNSEEADIKLGGALVLPQHCVLNCRRDEDTYHTITIRPSGDALVFVNGHQVEENKSVELQHSDRLVIGNRHFFRVNIPRLGRTDTQQENHKDTPFEEKNYQFAKQEFEAVQARRLELQLEEERRRVQAQLEAEHEEQRTAYQRALEDKMEKQRLAYEKRLEQLQKAITDNQSEKSILLQRFEKEASERQIEEREKVQIQLDELESEKRRLEQRLQEETQKEKQNLEEKNKIIDELTREKDTIQTAMEEMKRTTQSRKSLKSLMGKQEGNNEVFDVTVDPRSILATVQSFTEANKIAKDLDQNTMFTLSNAQGKPMVKVVNTNMKVATLWTIEKYEDRLRQMRDLYTEWESSGAVPDAVRELYFDPSDQWQAESHADLSEHSQAVDFFTTPRKNRSRLGSSENSSDNVGGVSGFTRSNSIRLRPKLAGQQLVAAMTAEATVPVICCKYIKNISAALGSADSRANELISSLSSLKVAAQVLHDAYVRHTSLPEDSRPLVSVKDTGVVRNASISATVSLHSIGTVVRNTKSQAETGLVLDLSQRISSSSVACAHNLIKLLQGIENEIPLMVKAGYEEILGTITLLSTTAGELAIVLDPKGDSTQDESGKSISDEDEYDDEEDEDALEAEVRAMMPARLVDLPDVSRQNSSPYFDDAITAATHHTVDSDILDAFQVGTRQFVEKSFAACKQDIAVLPSKLVTLKLNLHASSVLTEAIIEQVCDVVEKAVSLLSEAEQLQRELTVAGNSKRTIYNKSFTKARGVVVQVQDVTDAVVWLCDSCSLAAAGQEDLAQVMTRGQNLRTTAAHLQTASEFKANKLGLGQHKSLSNVKKSIGKVYSSTATFTKLSITSSVLDNFLTFLLLSRVILSLRNCSIIERFCLTAKSVIMRLNVTFLYIGGVIIDTNSISFVVKTFIFYSSRQCQDQLANLGKKVAKVPSLEESGRLSAVARQKQIMEEQAAIMRLESELDQRRHTLHSLRRSSYNSQTSAI